MLRMVHSIYLKKIFLDYVIESLFSKEATSVCSCNDIMLARGTLIHECTADQMICSQIPFSQRLPSHN